MKEKTRKIFTGFIIFLGIMWLCTLISRAVYAYQLPMVTAQKPDSKYVEHKVEAEGIVVAGGEIPVNFVSGLRLAGISVREGDRVEEGDLLFTVDLADLQEIIEEKQQEIDRLSVQMASIEENQALAQQKRDLELARAREDYDTTARIQDTKVGRAAEAYVQAEEDGEEGMDEKMKAALQSAAYAEADTKAERDEAVKDAGRRVEDALLPEASSSELTELSMEREKLSASLSVYQEVLQQEGQVFSERSGVVTGVSLSAGERIGDTAVLRLSDDTVPCQLKILISREQKKHVGLKDFVTVKLEGESEFQTAVTYLGESASGDGSYEILIPLSEGEGIPGQSGTLTASDAGEKYPFCIPVYALHSENTRSYVYAVKQREGILGEESYIEEINVTVQDQNENYAAITGALDGDTMIVVSATKEIKNGGTVRLQTQTS